MIVTFLLEFCSKESYFGDENYSYITDIVTNISFQELLSRDDVQLGVCIGYKCL